jgi:CBS domain-containing protein
MKARDIMTSPVITVRPRASVKEVAKTFLEQRISGAPVVDDQGALVGMVSEGDLLHRTESGTERRRSTLSRFLSGSHTLAADYVKSHAMKVADIMIGEVVTATPDTPLSEIATLMEKNSIKRVPIVDRGRVVGIVSRGNLTQAIASYGAGAEISLSDAAIRGKLLEHLRQQPWTRASRLNATVHNGVVDLWGHCYSHAELVAARVAAENIPGVRAVNNNLSYVPTDIMY